MLGLLSTMTFEKEEEDLILVSTDSSLPRPKRRMTEDRLEQAIKAPMQESSLHEVLVEGLVELCKVKPVGNDAIQWLGEWLISNNPNKPRVELPE